MPELPEAESIVRALRKVLRSRRFGRLAHLRTDILRTDTAPFRKAVIGRRVLDVRRHGKKIVLDMDGRWRLVFGLGMTGRLLVTGPADPREKHTHLVLTFDRHRRQLRFMDPRRFGGVWLFRAHQNGGDGLHFGRSATPIGDDALTIRLPAFRRIMRRKRTVKSLLLDQNLIAGVGNIYCDETLFAARIHPATPAHCLDDPHVRRLHAAMRRVLRRAIAHRGTTFMDYRNVDGRPGTFQLQHNVYNRCGMPCKTCKTPIQRIVIAARGTHLCPNCQPILDNDG